MNLNRQSFLGTNSEEVFRTLRVGVVGLGGGGSHIAQQLSHLGIGHFVIVDPDRIEDTNLNRLVSGTEQDVRQGRLKTEIIKRRIKAVNPKAIVDAYPARWEQDEAAVSLRNCDVVFGCIDSFAGRRDLEAAARRYLIPYIDIGMDVHDLTAGNFAISGQVAVSMPGRACLRCLGLLTDELLAEEARRYGAAGSRPQVVWSNGVLASMAVGLMVQIFTPWHHQMHPSLYLEFDGNLSEVKTSSRLPYVDLDECRHFEESNTFGDPFFTLPYL